MTIRKIETEERRPSRQIAARLAEALDIPLAERSAFMAFARAGPSDLASASGGGGYGLPNVTLNIPDPARAGVPTTDTAPRGDPHVRRYQLRPPVADFVGRSAEGARLVQAIQLAASQGGSAIIAGVLGMGGVGKTELAYQVAQQLLSVFPDAQLVLALRGTTAAPLTPVQALQTIIRTFTPSASLPDDLPALEAIYRSLLHGRRVLILADDARDAAQVRSLVPPHGCALLLTSRTRFTLPGIISVDLETLAEAEAVELLRGICPRLRNADTRAIVRACGALPLALRVSGGILRNTPALSIAHYLELLADQRQVLHVLQDPDDAQQDVGASLALSYAQLDAAAQQVFRQLGVLVADFSTALAQQVLVAPAGATVETVLHLLLRRNLVMYDAERGRWRLHDLVRALALRTLETEVEVNSTLWRYAQYTVRVARKTQEQYLAGGDQALVGLAQFDAERAHIDAGRRWVAAHMGVPLGDTLLVEDAIATWGIGTLRYNIRYDFVPQQKRALAAAQRLADRHGEGIILNALGYAHCYLGNPRQAIEYLERRQSLAESLGYHCGEGQVLSNLGTAYACLGMFEQTTRCLERALLIAQEQGERRLEATVLCNLGLTALNRGEPRKAILYIAQALQVAREVDLQCEGVTLDVLGRTYAELNEHAQADDSFARALDILRQIGDRRQEAYVLTSIGRALSARGELSRAFNAFSSALTIFREVGDRWGEAMCGWQYGLMLMQAGDRPRGLHFLHAAVAYEQDIGHVEAAAHAALVADLEGDMDLPLKVVAGEIQRMVGYSLEVAASGGLR